MLEERELSCKVLEGVTEGVAEQQFSFWFGFCLDEFLCGRVVVFEDRFLELRGELVHRDQAVHLGAFAQGFPDVVGLARELTIGYSKLALLFVELTDDLLAVRVK